MDPHRSLRIFCKGREVNTSGLVSILQEVSVVFFELVQNGKVLIIRSSRQALQLKFGRFAFFYDVSLFSKFFFVEGRQVAKSFQPFSIVFRLVYCAQGTHKVAHKVEDGQQEPSFAGRVCIRMNGCVTTP